MKIDGDSRNASKVSPNELSFKLSSLGLILNNKVIFTDLTFSFDGPGMVLIEGENGAGKSSALKVFAGLTIPSRGSVVINRSEPSLLKKGEFSFFTTTSMGVMSEFTGEEHIEMINTIMKIGDQELKKEVNAFKELKIFNEILGKKVCDMSQGMKQILRLFLHLYFKPKYLFLDEPFLYLSPHVKDFFMNKIEVLSKDSLIFITDQKFSWEPKANTYKISLGEK